MKNKEMLAYLKSTELYESDYDLKRVEQMLEENKSISIKDLVERFIDVDEFFHGEPWNIMQILTNVNIIIPIEDK